MLSRHGQGAILLGDGRCRFRTWAPAAGKVELVLRAPKERLVLMEAREWGYHEAVVEDIDPGALYLYRLDGDRERPDPASRCQPEGVHGPSQVVDPRFDWTDGGWFGIPLSDYVLYELHVGTFTPEGTFDAIVPHLDSLKELGVTAVELMPVAQFPGGRNWGYDGVYLYAVQHSYGGPDGLRRLVDACHQKGLAVVLDVVYNHLGPEGNYLAEFGPYFTSRYNTPWGAALNYDDTHNDQVRRFFIDNALSWLRDFHIDALRLDAVHAIRDFSAHPFLQEMAEVAGREAERLNRRFYLIPESALNDARLIRPPAQGGYGLDAQWSDDFHHALRTLLTGDLSGYYEDFGSVEHLAKAYREGFVYSGEYSAFRRCRHGNSSRPDPARQFVVFAQNHDQVGNRMRGERLGEHVPFAGLQLAAGVVLLSPYIPLLFMGEEYGETAPFPYFVSHTDPALIEAVRKGRREEFASFRWEGEVPDPQAEETFQSAKLHHALRNEGRHARLWAFYQELLRLRRAVPALAHRSKEHQEVQGFEKQRALVVRRWCPRQGQMVAVYHFGPAVRKLTFPLPPGTWDKVLDPAEGRWGGDGPQAPDELVSDGEATLELGPWRFALYGMRKK
jgi:maltooligosyltrehalose trehalohydrolase